MYQQAPTTLYYNDNAEREKAYNQYNNLAGSLQADIRELQKSINLQRTEREAYLPVTIPATIPAIAPQQRTDTVYIKETQVIRDTFFVTDTLLARPLPVRTDTVVKTVTLKPEKTGINYNQLPPTIVLFGLNKSNITPVYLKALNYVAGLLAKDSLSMATISGHTDRTGSARANEVVSLKRANAVKKFLLQKSVKENQLTIITLSGTQPVTAETGKIADSQNRRVEIKLGTRMK